MAETTITQNTTARLPEQKWYTLQEVATRWTGMMGQDVSPERVLHYGVTGLIDICFRPGFQPIHYRLRLCDVEETGHLSSIAGIKPVDIGNEGDIDYEARYAIGSLALVPVTRLCLLEIIENGSWAGEYRRITRVYGQAMLFDNEILKHWKPFVVPESGEKFIVWARFGMNAASKAPHITLKKENLLIPIQELHRFETHELGQPAPSETVALTGKLTPEIWQSFTPEQRGEHAAKRYAVLGSYVAVGREIGTNPETGKPFTGEGIKRHVESHKKRNKNTPSEKPNPPSVPSGWNTTLSK